MSGKKKETNDIINDQKAEDTINNLRKSGKTKKSSRKLGKGLDKLLKINVADLDDKEMKKLNLNYIVPNRFQPRENFSEEEINHLAASIKEVGLLQPVVVRKIDESHFELIAGERRLRACRQNGMEQIPAIIRTDLTDDDMLILALLENIQREDINPIEEGKSYEKLHRHFNMSHEDIALKIGKSRTAVTNMIRLLKLPEEIKRGIEEQEISTGHGRALLGLNDERKQIELFKIIKDKDISVRELEKIVRELKKDNEDKKEKERSSAVMQLEEELMEIFRNKVKLVVNEKKRKGKIELYFSNQDELDTYLSFFRDLE